MLALRQAGDLYGVYPASHPVSAGTGSSPATLKRISRIGWMDSCVEEGLRRKMSNLNNYNGYIERTKTGSPHQMHRTDCSLKLFFI